MKRRRPPPPEMDAATRAADAQFVAFIEAQFAAFFEAGKLPPPKSAEIIPFKKRPK
jgi:hypothetical protein